jgi:hypothetical protein
MEDKEKYSQISTRGSNIKEIIKKEKEQSNIQKINPSLPDKYYKFEIVYKNKELNKFKDDVLSYLRARDYFYMEKINSIKSQSDKNERNYQTLNELSLSTFNSLTSWQTEV